MSPRPRWQHHKHGQEAERIEIPLEPRNPAPHWQPGDGPPHGLGGDWAHGEWMQHNGQRHRQRHRMFARWVGAMLFLVLLVAGGITLVSHLWTGVGGANIDTVGAPPRVFYLWRFCGIVLLIPLFVWFVGRRIFRSYAVPLADIMDAADEVATGNLQVRVQERGSREFLKLATSFNRMTEELARVDQQRRNLTADVAHELRTPLHIIQGNLEGLLDGVYAPTPEHIEATLQETRTLARLVDDLRTLSLAESGQLPLHPEVVDVHDLLADVATSFSPQAESAGIHLCVEVAEPDGAEGTGEVDGTTPMTLYGDPGRLDQVLSNLVNNALRHTPSNGRITLGAARVQKTLGQKGHASNGTSPTSAIQNPDEQIELTVADTGEGIAPDDLPFIFDRFWRGDRARTHKEGTGSGLGLAITGQLVKAHGGTIAVASTPGRGTTFTVTLPTAAKDPQKYNENITMIG